MQLSAIKQMENYARGVPGIVSLSQGIPSMQTDALIRYCVIEAILANKVDKYSDPQGLLEFRQQISSKLKEESMHYSCEEIIVTSGAVEAMSATLLSLIVPGDEVIIPTPTYSAFLRIADMAKAKVIELRLDEANEWQIDIEYMKEVITDKTKAIILCNPNNPTGSIYSESFLKAVCTLAEKHGFYVLLDEVYRNMLFEDQKFYTPAKEESFKKRLIRIVSFSKDFSLTGWRVGFLHTDKTLIKKILPIHDNLVNCAPVVSQYAGIAALLHDKQIISDHLKVYTKRRNIMGLYLQELSEHLSFTWPKGSYFFFPKIYNRENSADFCIKLLQGAKVAVVPGSEFGRAGEGHIRLCFGRSEPDIIEGMKRLKLFLRSSSL